MANSIEESRSVPKLSDAKANLRKWGEECFQMYQNKQFLQNQNVIEGSPENRRHLEKDTGAMFENSSGSNLYDSNVTVNSTPTAHMARCFSDSSQNNSVLEVKCDIPNITVKKLKKPFLRKKSGLVKYMPKSIRHLEESKKIGSTEDQETIPYSQFELNLNSAKRTSRTVRFQEPECHAVRTHFGVEKSRSLGNIDENYGSEEDINYASSNPKQKESDSGGEIKENVADIPELGRKNDAISPEEQLAEFEFLETYAQNSSFNSDCSVVQRVLRNEPVLGYQSRQVVQLKSIETEPQRKHFNYSPLPNLSKMRQEILMKKQEIENIVQDINPRIDTLEKEISHSIEEILTDVGRCSTPLEQNFLQNQHQVHLTANCDVESRAKTPAVCNSQNDSKPFLIDEETSSERFQTYPDLENNKLKNATDCDSNSQVTSSTLVEKSILREKIEELEKEIEIYQQQNKHLSFLCREREEISRKLKKEYDAIEKFKQEQKKKLEFEIENERHQMERQKETFNRYQRLRNDNPTRKEREELTSLRQEIDKLKEELKRQKINFTSDNRRMRNKLMEAENERDSLKLKNITLEEQCEDLLKALKARQSKMRKSDLYTLNKIDGDTNSSNETQTEDIQKDNVNSMKRYTVPKNSKVNSILKPRVHFNLIPEFEKGAKEESESEKFSSCEIEHHKPTEPSDEDSGLENTNLSECEESPTEEVKNDDKVIYPSGDKEIQYSNYNEKIIHDDDGTTKIMFHNGDILEIYPDKQKIYKYVNGMVEKSFPCGLTISKFPNGQIERIFSDGSREVTFPDGTIQYVNTDGSENIIGTDGTTVMIGVDGTEIVEKINGEKEIRTKSYKRREYPDGSVRILYPSGRIETRYSNGRIKIKDKNDKVIVDTKHI